MMPSDLLKLQKLEKEKELKDLQYVKISNSLLECFVVKKNIIAIKIVLSSLWRLRALYLVPPI